MAPLWLVMIEERPKRLQQFLVAAYTLAALGSLIIAMAPFIGIGCQACTGGLLSISLPWAGVLLYSCLAVIGSRTPSSVALSIAPGFYLFVHGSLVTEMFIVQPPCVGCLIVAALAVAAASCQLGRSHVEWPTSAIAALLGIIAGFFTPFDRLDDLSTRMFWPTHILDSAPSWVSRDQMLRCEHPFTIRLIAYEKDCKS